MASIDFIRHKPKKIKVGHIETTHRDNIVKGYVVNPGSQELKLPGFYWHSEFHPQKTYLCHAKDMKLLVKLLVHN